MALGDVEGLLAEDLARRELDHTLERRLGRHPGLEHVVRPDQVHPHRPHRAREDGVDSGNCGRVDDVRDAARHLAERVRVEHVALYEGESGMVGEPRAAERVAVKIVERDHLVRVYEPLRERGTDKAGATGDQNSLPLERHAASVMNRSAPPRE